MESIHDFEPGLMETILYKEFYSYLWRPFGSEEHNLLGNFGNGAFTEHICVKLFEFEPAVHIRSRCCFLLSLWLAVVSILFGRVEPFRQFW